MKAWILALACLIGGPALAAEITPLSFQGGALVAHAAWETGPRSPQESVLRLEWRTGAGVPADAGEVRVALFMPDMGHGSAPTRVEAVSDGAGRRLPGVVRVRNMYFTMGGLWEVRVTLRSAGVAETQSFALTLPGGGHHHLQGLLNPAAELASSPALAAICADGVTAHPRLKGYWHIDRPSLSLGREALFATMHLRPSEEGEYTVVAVDRADPSAFRELKRFKEPVRDLAFGHGELWALFRDRIVQLDPATGAVLAELNTVPNVREEDESARAFAWVGDRLVVAHGSLGFVAYDRKARGFTMAHDLGLTQGRHLSKAVEVTAVSDTQAAFGVEDVTIANHPPYAFNGILLVNFSGAAFTERYAYDRKSSGVISHPRLTAVNGELLINNWGILQHVGLAELRQAGAAHVHWTPLRIEAAGASLPAELLGDLLVENDTVFGCAHVQYRQGKAIEHKGVVYQSNVAAALGR